MVAVEVVLGDITRQDVDAVVTAANESLLGGGGVDGAIHRAAGPRLAAAGAEVGPCAPGDAVATPAFDLAPIRHVIHTVGPVWEGGDDGEPALLARCYRASLQLAAEHHLAAIAFPAISCGVFGYPHDLAVAVSVEAVRAWPAASPRRVLFCCFGEAMAARYRALLAAA